MANNFIEELRNPLFRKRKDGGLIRINQTFRLAKAAKERLSHLNEETASSLSHFVLENDVVDGDRVLSDYFPTIKADVFISHSHNDVNLAYALSQWLYEEFNLVAFVDSSIWGSGDKLIYRLDKKYCCQEKRGFYDYDKRNLTTSFVHLMLASAISKMIDSCRCLLFLNTPNSLSGNPEENKTGSPWIFYELLMAKLLQRHRLERHNFSESGRIDESISFVVQNTIPINFPPLNVDNLRIWLYQYSRDKEKDPLEVLYHLYG